MNQLRMFTRNGMATREAMMHAATDHADREIPQWSQVAFHFLENYARTHGEIFTPETITDAAVKWGLEKPPTFRAWGSLYRRAQNARIIEWVDNNAKRYNGSPAPRYRSLIYREAA